MAEKQAKDGSVLTSISSVMWTQRKFYVCPYSLGIIHAPPPILYIFSALRNSYKFCHCLLNLIFQTWYNYLCSVGHCFLSSYNGYWIFLELQKAWRRTIERYFQSLLGSYDRFVWGTGRNVNLYLILSFKWTVDHCQFMSESFRPMNWINRFIEKIWLKRMTDLWIIIMISLRISHEHQGKLGQLSRFSVNYYSLLLKYTLPVKSFWTVRFVMFFKEVSSAQQACIYLIQSTAKQFYFEIFLLFKITVFYLNIF